MENRIAELVRRNKELLEKSRIADEKFKKCYASLQLSIKEYKENKGADVDFSRVINTLDSEGYINKLTTTTTILNRIKTIK
jgi:hypothetical protein